MKDNKDYLPYYIGQNMVHASHHEPQFEPYVLTVENLAEAIEFLDLPILRRLSDMTEEEMKALYMARTLWAYVQESHIKKIQFSPSNKNCITIDYEGPSGSGGYTCGHELIYLNQLMPNQFHYLLKQGFDLFKLIDNNLAVDAKSLNQQA